MDYIRYLNLPNRFELPIMHVTGRQKTGNPGKGALMQDRISHDPCDVRPACSSPFFLLADPGAAFGPDIHNRIHTAIEAGISGAAPLRHAGHGSATPHEETSNELRPKDTTVR
jgi:hypothetical protein